MTNNRYVKIHDTDITAAIAMAPLGAESRANFEGFSFPYSPYKTVSAFMGRDPLKYEFTLRSPDRSVVQAAAKAIMLAPSGANFYPGRSDRFVVFERGHVSPTEDILIINSSGDEDFIYQAEVEILARHPFLLSDVYQWGDISVMGEFVDIENNGDIPAPLSSFYVQSYYDGSDNIESPNLVISDSDYATYLASVELSTLLHTDEMMNLDILAGTLNQRYVDTLTDTNKWQRDNSDSDGTITFSTGKLRLESNGAFLAYNFNSDFPINQAPMFRARINCSNVAECAIMYQTERLSDWMAGPDIVNDVWAEYPLTGAIGKKNFTLVFYVTASSVDMDIYGMDLEINRHIPEDDIPSIDPGVAAAFTLESSAGTDFNAAGKFHNLYLK